MEVLDIIQSAAFKSGVISSFNPDECPDDVLNAGKDVLAYDILPGLNCDRTLDITETSRVYPVQNGRVVLKPFKQPKENVQIIGYSDKIAQTLLANNGTKLFQEIRKLHHDWVYDNLDVWDGWPRDDLGNYFKVAMWSSDMHLVYGTYQIVSNDGTTFRRSGEFDANIDFPPMRVDAVLDEHSRISYEYLYREEFERTIFRNLPGCYTTEEYEDSIVILIKGTDDLKRIVLPVPLQIVDMDHARAGVIHAPEKFKRYLIDCTAVALARIYGMSSLPDMKEAAAVSYNLLKKNKPQPLHKANVSEEMTDKLRTNFLGRRFYANI